MALEQQAIKRAKSILVVGGGPVGVEVMGELVYLNNNPTENQAKKKLTMVTRTPTILSNFNSKTIDYATGFFLRNEVELLVNTEYDLMFQQL